MQERAEIRLDYGRPPDRDVRLPGKRTLVRIAIVLAVLTLLVRAPYVYINHKRAALSPGMSRKQVDAELWAFRSYPFAYNALDPGQVQVVYEADGRLSYEIPDD